MAKKRAPGGGRKPQGEFSDLTRPLTIRMPENMREELEIAAKKTGKSVSQELLRRLHDSFYRDRKRSDDPASYALCFLLAELIELVNVNTSPAGAGSTAWRRNPFAFKTIQLAFQQVLAALQPRGEIAPPPKLIEERAISTIANFGATTPEDMAERAATWMLYSLSTPRREKVSRDYLAPRAKNFEYGIDRAGQDLSISSEDKS